MKKTIQNGKVVPLAYEKTLLNTQKAIQRVHLQGRNLGGASGDQIRRNISKLKEN